MDLLLGPERLSRSSPIDEHDFFERRYLDENGDPIPIKLEVVLTGLNDDVLTKFRTHREHWNTATNELLDETATPEDVDNDDVVPALRIKFEGVYDVEDEIADVFDAAWELEQIGIEDLLADETTIEVIHNFLEEASERDDYPHNQKKPKRFADDPDNGDNDVRQLCKQVLKSRKGSGYAQRLVELCSAGDLPDVITEALEHISEALPNEISNDEEDEGGDVRPSDNRLPDAEDG